MTNRPEYVAEKLRAASTSITGSSLPIADRLNNAFVYGISMLEAGDFGDSDDRAEFLAIDEGLTAFGEARDGEGSAPTTLELIDESEALRLAERIVRLSARVSPA